MARANSRAIPRRPSEKRNMTFPFYFGFHSFGRKIFILPVITNAYRLASTPPLPKKECKIQKEECGSKIISLFRSRSDHVRAEQEHRLDDILLEPGPQVRQQQPHCEEPLDADLRHRERSEREATGPHGSGVG